MRFLFDTFLDTICLKYLLCLSAPLFCSSNKTPFNLFLQKNNQICIPGLVTSRHTTRLTSIPSKTSSRKTCDADVDVTPKPAAKDPGALSTREIERDRGKPLSKYERNVMIFDWLHTLDESATVDFS